MVNEQTLVRRLVIAATVLGIAAGFGSTGAAAFQFRKIVDTDTPIPGGGGNFGFNNSSLPAVDRNWVVFSTGDMTLWRSTRIGTQLKKLVTANTFIPGWRDSAGERLKFSQFYGQFMQVFGDTLVVVALPCAGCNSGVGIFTRSVLGGAITKLVDKKDTHPAFPGDDKHFGNFSEDFSVNSDLVVFQNRGSVFSVPVAGGPVTAVARDSSKNFSPPCPYCPIFGSPSRKGPKVLLTAGNVFGHGSIQTVSRSGNNGSFAFVATHGMHAPRTPANHGFNRFEFWGPVIDQTLVFGGGSSVDANDIGPYIKGIYARGENLVRLADSNMAVPGGTGNFNFTWGGSKSPIVAGNGIVVFGAQDTDNKKGLYAVRQTGGRIRKIIAVGDPIGGFTVEGLNIGKGAFDGSTLVFSVGYANFQGAGMYSTQVVLP
jgi:hypothetical protein